MKLPTFSIIIETANLSMAELEGLQGTLESMSQQTIPMDKANDVVIVDSGDVPEDELQKMLNAYPWVRALRFSNSTGYEELKMEGVKGTTGDVVVFADGDCFYEKRWLEALLTPFSDPSVTVVGGETNIDSRGAYGLGVAIAFSFPARGPLSGIYQTDRYHLNNVAFRRSVLTSIPIPSRKPCYRMTGLHVAALQAAGHTIWRDPSARARHAPPNGFSHYMWRFLLFGHDGVVVPKLIAAQARSTPSRQGPRRTAGFFLRRWITESTGKLFQEIRREPSRVVTLPLVLPVVAGAVVFQAAGALAGLVAPKRLLQAMPEDILRASTCTPGMDPAGGTR